MQESGRRIQDAGVRKKSKLQGRKIRVTSEMGQNRPSLRPTQRIIFYSKPFTLSVYGGEQFESDAFIPLNYLFLY